MDPVNLQILKLKKATLFCLEGKEWPLFTLILVVFSPFFLGSCSTVPNKIENYLEKSSVGHVSTFLGGIAVDEPRAALVGRDILLAGGSAVDAAVSAYFTLAVTKPSAASLGGGGICLVRNSGSKTIETLDFRTRPPKLGNTSTEAQVGIPGNAFGFFALHAKYGKLKWRQLIQPAEHLARFGFKISRSLGQDLHMAEKILSRDENVKKIFFKKNGFEIRSEGNFVKQSELSALLSLIKSKGAGGLYQGPIAQQFVEAIKLAGGRLTYQDLREFKPKWGKTIEVPFVQNTTLHFPSSPRKLGIQIAQVMSMLTFNDLYEDGDREERAHLIAESLERSLSDSRRWGKTSQDDLSKLSPVSEEYIESLLSSYDANRRIITPGATEAELDPTSQSSGASLTTMDSTGSAVACSLSMNRPFGMGRIARGTGVFLSAIPNDKQIDQSLSAVILDNKLGNNIFYTSAASGGATAVSSIINVAIELLVTDNSNLRDSIKLKRIHHGGADGITYIEKGISSTVLEGLARRGHKLAYVNSMGLVNSIFCRAGMPRKNPEDIDCAVATDPRGHGLSNSVN